MFRRPIRYALNGSTLLSLLACVGTGWLWWRSYHAATADVLTWQTRSDNRRIARHISFLTCHGGFQIEDYRLRLKPGNEVFHFDAFPPALTLAHPDFCMLPEWTRPTDLQTLDILGYPFGWPDLWGEPPRFQLHSDRMEDRAFINIWYGVVAPYWMPFALFAVTPLLSLTLRCRRAVTDRRRRRRGLCRRCGYDLTGNVSGRCSECGEAVVATAPV